MIKYFYKKKLKSNTNLLVEYFKCIDPYGKLNEERFMFYFVILFLYHVHFNDRNLKIEEFIEDFISSREHYTAKLIQFMEPYCDTEELEHWIDFLDAKDLSIQCSHSSGLHLQNHAHSALDQFFVMGLNPAFFYAVKEHFFGNCVNIKSIIHFLEPVYLMVGIKVCLENDVIFFKKLGAKPTDKMIFELGKRKLTPMNIKMKKVQKHKQYVRGYNLSKMTNPKF